MKRSMLLLGVLLSFAATCFAGVPAPKVNILPPGQKPGKGPSEYYQKRMEIFRTQNPEAPWKGIVLLGDSITEQFPSDELFKDLPVVNRGIGGDKVGGGAEFGVIERLEETVEILEPKVIVLMIGINDIIWTEQDNETILRYYAYLLWKIQEDLRETKLLVQSVLPTRGEFAKQNKRIVGLNKGIRQLAQKYRADYLDLHSVMKNEKGELKEEFSKDGLHLTRAAYEEWTKQLRPILEKEDWSKITGLMNLKKLHYSRIEQFEEENAVLPKDARPVVFFGDSLTQGFELEKYFPGVRVLNRGIVADTLGAEPGHRGLSKRLDSAVVKPQPSRLFILAGVNDINDGVYTNGELIAVYGKMLDKIKKSSPQTEIYVQSALPVREKYAHLLPTIRDYNEKLKQLAEKKRVNFIDLWPVFADDKGELPAELTKDGVHINEEGYAKWAKAVEKFVRE